MHRLSLQSKLAAPHLDKDLPLLPLQIRVLPRPRAILQDSSLDLRRKGSPGEGL